MNKQKLYSRNKEFPSPLPERIVMEDGTVYTSTFELSEEQLKNLGFDGPYYYPDFVDGYQKVICDFNTKELIVVDISEDEKQKKISEKWEMIRSIRNKENTGVPSDEYIPIILLWIIENKFRIEE